MSSSTTNLIKKGIAGAVLGANTAAAAAITSGVAMTTVSTPVTILFGLVQIGVTTTTVVVAPVAIAFAIGGGVIGGALWAFRANKEDKAMNREFEQYFPKSTGIIDCTDYCRH